MKKSAGCILGLLVLASSLRIAMTPNPVLASAAEVPVHPQVKVPVAPISPQPPAFSPGAGTYAQEQMVTIWDPTPGVIFYYTTDGSTPTTSSSRYAGPAAIGRSVTLKAIAVNAHGHSIVSSGVYIIK